MNFSAYQLVVRRILCACGLVSLSACQLLSETATASRANLNSLPALSSQKQIYLLGEVHDNAAGHQARFKLIQHIFAQHQQEKRELVLVLEQFDLEQQAQLQAAQAQCKEAQCLLQAMQGGGTNTQQKNSSWHWPYYQDLVQLALDKQIPLVAGNLSRQLTRKVVQGKLSEVMSVQRRQVWQFEIDSPKNPHAALLQAQQQQVLQAHCQQLPPQLAPGMASAQMARDILMAERLLQAHSNVVLVAGNGHIRNDLGVPYWLNFARQAGFNPAQWHSVAFLEQAPGRNQYADQWQLIPVQPRPDPCAGFSPTPPKAKEAS